jgi:hypothetical protein
MMEPPDGTMNWRANRNLLQDQRRHDCAGVPAEGDRISATTVLVVSLARERSNVRFAPVDG